MLLFGLFPWSGFLPIALYHALKHWRNARDTTQEISRPLNSYELDLFAALWVVGVFLFFSLSATRLPHYIGPLFPAGALL
ncbi:MAG: glycosyltransferase, partial [Nitrospiraceae bacterium]